MSSSGAFLRLDLVSTRDKMTHVEGHHEISTSYLNAIELLPIWIMFIDRIIDKIQISVVTLSSELSNRNHFDNSSSTLNSRGVELLNSERFVRCCIGVALNGPFLTAQNSAIKRCPQCRHSYIIR